MQKIMNRGPWLFEISLLSLNPFNGYTPIAKMVFSKEVFWVNMHNLPVGCMNEKIGIDIGKTISRVIWCVVQHDGSRWEQSSVCALKWIYKNQTLGVEL